MARIRNLEVYSDESGQFERLPSYSSRYAIVESLTHLGISVLESSQGRQSLINIATSIVTERDARKRAVLHLYNHSLSQIPHEINKFLRKIRNDFPTIYLTTTVGEAMAVRRDWGNDLIQYDPKAAGHLEVNKSVINNMLFAGQQLNKVAGDNYNLFKYQMGIAIAHEIVHFLTGYFTGTVRLNTPPGVSLTSYGNKLTGEAGRYWQSILLGGVVEFYEDTQDTLRHRQAGIPYLIDDGRSSAPARQISMNYIDDFLNGNFYFPVRLSSSSESTTRSNLRRSLREMSELRPRRNAPAFASPPRGNTPFGLGGTSVHRRLPIDYRTGFYPEYRVYRDVQNYGIRSGY